MWFVVAAAANQSFKSKWEKENRQCSDWCSFRYNCWIDCPVDQFRVTYTCTHTRTSCTQLKSKNYETHNSIRTVKLHLRIKRCKMKRSICVYYSHGSESNKKTHFVWMWIHSCVYGVLNMLNEWTMEWAKSNNNAKEKKLSSGLQLLIHSHFRLAIGDCPSQRTCFIVMKTCTLHTLHCDVLYQFVNMVFSFHRFRSNPISQ